MTGSNSSAAKLSTWQHESSESLCHHLRHDSYRKRGPNLYWNCSLAGMTQEGGSENPHFVLTSTEIIVTDESQLECRTNQSTVGDLLFGRWRNLQHGHVGSLNTSSC